MGEEKRRRKERGKEKSKGKILRNFKNGRRGEGKKWRE
jgi:hypothetical protein